MTLAAFLGISYLCTQFTLSRQANTKDFVGVLAGNNNLTVFADGLYVGHNGGVWNTARWFSFSKKTEIIAVCIYNVPRTWGEFLGVFSNGVVTDRSWKCKETDGFDNDWMYTNYSDDTWPQAYMRQNNSVTKLLGIPSNVHWVSPANHWAQKFICRRRFSAEERKSNSSLVSILGRHQSNVITLYLDGVLKARVRDSLTLITDQHNLQAVQVEDSNQNFVSFLASSSNGVKSDERWRCANVYHDGWFLPCYNDSAWRNVFVVGSNNDSKIKQFFIAPEAKWITYDKTTKKIYCRQKIDMGAVTSCTSHQTSITPFVPTVQISSGLPTFSNQTNSTRHDPSESSAGKKGTDNRLSKSLIVVIAVSGGGTAVIIGLAVSFYIWTKRRNKRENDSKQLQNQSHTNDKWEVKSDDVTLCEELGHGAFGKVYKGNIKSPSCMADGSSAQQISKKKIDSTITVAVKMLQEDATLDQMKDFLDEINLMKAVGSHKNIVSLIGCCTQSSQNFLIVEFASQGDLLSYLRDQRKKVQNIDTVYLQIRGSQPNTPTSLNDIGEVNVAFSNTDSSIDMKIYSSQLLEDNEPDQDNQDSFTSKDMMSFSWQIAQGMQYLSGKGIVHRDLAARNVLVCENRLVKVADFGLARNTLGDDVYHTTGEHNKLPVKWMSPEAISDGVFTVKSDVWSYGVVLWEITTLGGHPYPGIKNRELKGLLKRGYRMEKPDTCSEEFFQLMSRCWADNPDARPTFTELCQDLEDWMLADTPYLDVDQVDENQPYYNASAVSTSSGSSCEKEQPESGPDLHFAAENKADNNND